MSKTQRIKIHVNDNRIPSCANFEYLPLNTHLQCSSKALLNWYWWTSLTIVLILRIRSDIKVSHIAQPVSESFWFESRHGLRCSVFFVPGSPLKTSSFTTPDYRILLLQDTWKVKLERGRLIWIKIFPICHSAPAFMNYTTIQNSRTFSSIPEFTWQKTSDFSINEFESRLKQELKLSTTWYINISENSFLD